MKVRNNDWARRHARLVGLLLLQASCGGALPVTAPPSPPPPPPSPPPSVSAPQLPAPPSPVALPRCRPEVRGETKWAPQIAETLEELFSRMLYQSGNGWLNWTEGLHGRAPTNALVVATIQDLMACPLYFEVNPSDTAGIASGHLVFKQSELGALRAGFVRGWGPNPEHPVLHLYSLENEFRNARARTSLVPILARVGPWIPSGSPVCSGMGLALFRGARTNVLCAAGADQGKKTRCFEFEASPSGRLHLEIVHGAAPPPLCAVGTNVVFGPDLGVQMVPYRQYRFERNVPVTHLGSEPVHGTQWLSPLPRAWTELPRKWTEVDAAQFPVAEVVELTLSEVSREDIGASAPPAIEGAGLFCLRIDDAWRCKGGSTSPGRIQVRSEAGATFVSMADKHYNDGGFVHFMEVDGAALAERARFPLSNQNWESLPPGEGGRDLDISMLLEQRWEYVHEAPRCLRVTGARATRLVHRDQTNRNSRSWTEHVPVVYGAAPASLPRMAPPMPVPKVREPAAMADLRGSWQLEGEAWVRVASCSKAAP